MEEVNRITSKGIDWALDVLDKAGFIPDPPSESYTKNLTYLYTACDKYIEMSKAKGDSRTDEENMNGVLMAFFQAYLRACLTGAVSSESEV